MTVVEAIKNISKHFDITVTLEKSGNICIDQGEDVILVQLANIPILIDALKKEAGIV